MLKRGDWVWGWMVRLVEVVEGISRGEMLGVANLGDEIGVGRGLGLCFERRVPMFDTELCCSERRKV